MTSADIDQYSLRLHFGSRPACLFHALFFFSFSADWSIQRPTASAWPESSLPRRRRRRRPAAWPAGLPGRPGRRRAAGGPLRRLRLLPCASARGGACCCARGCARGAPSPAKLMNACIRDGHSFLKSFVQKMSIFRPMNCPF